MQTFTGQFIVNANFYRTVFHKQKSVYLRESGFIPYKNNFTKAKSMAFSDCASLILHYLNGY